MAGQPKRRIRSDFTLGEGVAEFDSLLSPAFYETALYRALRSRDDRRCFVVGRTGSGKSACFKRLAEEYPAHVIEISPDDLSLTYINELGVVQYLQALGVHLDSLFIALWKHVLIVEILKHRYHVDSIEAKQRFFSALMERVKRDRTKQEALEYLENFEGKFWNTTEERVREIVTRVESDVRTATGGKLSAGIGAVSADGSESSKTTTEEKVQLQTRLQRLVNETQLSRLSRMERVLDDDILDPQCFTYILIDDLDRDWTDEATTNDLIRCLFRAVHDLQKVANLKVLVALRTNIFESLDFGRTGGQEEKFRALIHRVTWTSGDLRELLDARIRVAAERHGLSGVTSIDDVLPHKNPTMGDPAIYVIERTLRRPRDAITFLNECFPLARGRDVLTWNVIQTAEASYSANRLLALRDEWKPTYPGIDQLFQKFKAAPTTLNWHDLTKILDNCALLLANRDFAGEVWLKSKTTRLWCASAGDDHVALYEQLVRLLFNIGFLGCISETEEVRRGSHRTVDEPAVYSHDDPNFADSLQHLRGVASFCVHPAFRKALEIRG